VFFLYNSCALPTYFTGPNARYCYNTIIIISSFFFYLYSLRLYFSRNFRISLFDTVRVRLLEIKISQVDTAHASYFVPIWINAVIVFSILRSFSVWPGDGTRVLLDTFVWATPWCHLEHCLRDLKLYIFIVL